MQMIPAHSLTDALNEVGGEPPVTSCRMAPGSYLAPPASCYRERS